MRLDKYLADLGVGSRQIVKEYIRSGKVSLNGEIVKKPEFSVPEDAEVLVNGEPLQGSSLEYWLLYKPAGYVTARTDNKYPCVMDLVPSKRKDLSPVGRLDVDTEGVLLITNDGALNHQLVGPKNETFKTYYAELDVDLPSDATEKLAQPIEFKDFISKPAQLEVVNSRTGLLTVSEGKYHEVKRLFHAIGCEVVYLRRERFGSLTLEGMQKGDIRLLTNEEIEVIREKK